MPEPFERLRQAAQVALTAADLTDIVVGPAGFRVFARRPTSGAEASVFVSFDEVELAGGNPLVAAVHQVNHDLGEMAGRQRVVNSKRPGERACE